MRPEPLYVLREKVQYDGDESQFDGLEAAQSKDEKKDAEESKDTSQKAGDKKEEKSFDLGQSESILNDSEDEEAKRAAEKKASK